MKSLERRFRNIQKRCPFWSSFVCFYQAIQDQGFSRQTIHRWFNKLVEKDDYHKAEKKALLKHLEESVEDTDDNKKPPQIAC